MSGMNVHTSQTLSLSHATKSLTSIKLVPLVSVIEVVRERKEPLLTPAKHVNIYVLSCHPLSFSFSIKDLSTTSYHIPAFAHDSTLHFPTSFNRELEDLLPHTLPLSYLQSSKIPFLNCFLLCPLSLFSYSLSLLRVFLHSSRDFGATNCSPMCCPNPLCKI